jgi:hypothetical protein
MRAINLDGVPNPPKEKRKRKKPKLAKKPTSKKPMYAGVASGFFAGLPGVTGGNSTYTIGATANTYTIGPWQEGQLTPDHVAATQNDPWQIRMRARNKYPELCASTLKGFPLSEERLNTLREKVKGGQPLDELETMFAEFIL